MASSKQMDDFSVSMALTKKELIQKYGELLNAYKDKVRKVEQTKERLTEAEKRQDDDAIVIASEVSVPGAIDAIATLRQVITSSFSELTEELTEQTQRLAALDRAIELKEAKLTELHDIDVVADGLGKLIRLYEERRAEAEEQFTKRLSEMRSTLTDEREHLEEEIEQTRQSWKTERAQEEEAQKLAATRQKLERERERADYLYERDLERRREEDAYAERRAKQEQELADTRQKVERELEERAAHIAEREQELMTLRARVEAFPQEIEQAVEAAASQATESLRREHAMQLELAEKERQWERRMLEQRIEHLQATQRELHDKIAEQKGELSTSSTRVQQIAEKAVEGASMSRAYQSVHDITMEQARRAERSKPGEPS